MPIKKVPGGYKWGEHGHVYPSEAGAQKQAAAAFANGYKGNSNEKAKKKKKSKKRT